MRRRSIAAALSISAVLGAGILTGCDDDTSVEDVETALEEGVEDAGGAVEDAGTDIQEGADDVGGAVEDGVDATGEAVEDAGDAVDGDDSP